MHQVAERGMASGAGVGLSAHHHQLPASGREPLARRPARHRERQVAEQHDHDLRDQDLLGERDGDLPGKARHEIEVAPDQGAVQTRRRIGGEADVGIDEEQGSVPRQCRQLMAGMLLAVPPRRQRSAAREPDAGVRPGPLRHDGGGRVGRSVIEDDHLDVRVPLGQRAVQGGRDVAGLVAGRDQDRDPWHVAPARSARRAEHREVHRGHARVEQGQRQRRDGERDEEGRDHEARSARNEPSGT